MKETIAVGCCSEGFFPANANYYSSDFHTSTLACDMLKRKGEHVRNDNATVNKTGIRLFMSYKAIVPPPHSIIVIIRQSSTKLEGTYLVEKPF